ncbi:hypothetical protein PR003_g13811 [Phytophthora rubi]|uniref:Uncharacterized protein n=1 Tax=Phytophthora rubi TaxID=129364 RepID=A0A6A4F176_9STRA|nr:hypothetical protein PR003_g13811 [Phytophthora rubi]
MTTRAARAARRSSTPTGSTSAAPSTDRSSTPAAKRQRVARTRLRLNNTSGDADAGSDMVIGGGTLAGSGDADMDDDIVAGGVTLATSGGSILHTDNGRSDEDHGRQSSSGSGLSASSGGNQPLPQPLAARAPRMTKLCQEMTQLDRADSSGVRARILRVPEVWGLYMTEPSMTQWTLAELKNGEPDPTHSQPEAVEQPGTREAGESRIAELAWLQRRWAEIRLDDVDGLCTQLEVPESSVAELQQYQR